MQPTLSAIAEEQDGVEQPESTRVMKRCLILCQLFQNNYVIDRSEDRKGSPPVFYLEFGYKGGRQGDNTIITLFPILSLKEPPAPKERQRSGSIQD